MDVSCVIRLNVFFFQVPFACGVLCSKRIKVGSLGLNLRRCWR